MEAEKSVTHFAESLQLCHAKGAAAVVSAVCRQCLHTDAVQCLHTVIAGIMRKTDTSMTDASAITTIVEAVARLTTNNGATPEDVEACVACAM